MPKFSPLAVLGLSATLLMIGVGMIVALLPQRIHALTAEMTSVGLIASVFALAYLLAQLPIAISADRIGAKWFLVAGYGLCAMAGLAFLTAQTSGGIYIGRALQGLGEAPVWRSVRPCYRLLTQPPRAAPSVYTTRQFTSV